MYSAYVLCACFASVNCGPRTAVAGVVAEYSRGRNSFPGLKYRQPLRFWFAFRFPNYSRFGFASLCFRFV